MRKLDFVRRALPAVGAGMAGRRQREAGKFRTLHVQVPAGFRFAEVFINNGISIQVLELTSTLFYSKRLVKLCIYIPLHIML